MSRSMHGYDTFADCVQLSENRAIIVHHRLYGSWEYVRFRNWNRHLELGCWYPAKRSFVVAADYAHALADAIHAAADCKAGDKPAWLDEHERQNPPPVKGKAARRF